MEDNERIVCLYVGIENQVTEKHTTDIKDTNMSNSGHRADTKTGKHRASGGLVTILRTARGRKVNRTITSPLQSLPSLLRGKKGH